MSTHPDSFQLKSAIEQWQVADDTLGAYVLEDGGGALITRAWLTKQATESIDIQYFIFSTDNVGLIACDFLVQAADRGVQVRILVDDIMVEADIKQVLTLDAHPNIHIRIYNPGMNLGKNLLQKLTALATDFRGANQRMHNKLFIVDKLIGITGGRNVADEYFDYDHEYNFRDRDVMLVGPVIAEMSTSFESFWNHSLSVPVSELSEEKVAYSEQLFDRLHSYTCDPENFLPEVRERIDGFGKDFKAMLRDGHLLQVDSVLFVSDRPGKNDGLQGLAGGGQTTDALVELVNSAKHSIVIQTPYLITDEDSRTLFRNAVDRGVIVKIMTNSLASTDNTEAFSGYQRGREELLATGVKVYEYKPNAAIRKSIMTSAMIKEVDETPIFGLHAKTMVVDSKVTAIGTFNLDPRSANLNTECIAIIESKGLSEQVSGSIEEEMKPENCWEVTIDFNPDQYAGERKIIRSWTKKIIPKDIL